MTNAEFKREFNVMYDEASKGGPALNNYEISLFLTQAIRDIIDELYPQFEKTEYNKRSLAPLIAEKSLVLTKGFDFFNGFKVTEAQLPTNLYYILQENITLQGQKTPVVEVISEDLDHINKTMQNPFKQPNARKVLRTQMGKDNVRIYSSTDVVSFKIKYLKQYSPIIVSNLTTDPDLLGTETIDGLSVASNTDLPVFLHHKIVDRAVVLAVRSLRLNNLKTQIEV